MTLTLVSLFDGIGGFPLAFGRAGARTVATVEIDTAAATVSKRHFPDAHQFDDVTKVTGDELRSVGFIPDRGIITAGWPCQDFSVAGRRQGLAGARSGLWWHVVRLLDETRPRWFVGENVPGLLSLNGGQDFGAVLGSLGELGYGFAYRILDAQHFGVPQRRRRVFIVGHLGEPFGKPAEILFEPESSDRDSAAGGEAGAGVAGGVAVGVGNPCCATGHTHTRSRRCRAAGNAATGSTPNQQQAGTSSSRNVVAALTSDGVGTCGADDNQAQAGHIVVQPLAIRGREGGAMLEIGEEGAPYNALRAGNGGSGRNPLIAVTGFHMTQDPISSVERVPAIGAKFSGNGVQRDTTVRRLTELECERLQGYPDGWTEGQSGAARYRQLGNSVAVPVVQWIADRLVAVDGGGVNPRQFLRNLGHMLGELIPWQLVDTVRGRDYDAAVLAAADMLADAEERYDVFEPLTPGGDAGDTPLQSPPPPGLNLTDLITEVLTDHGIAYGECLAPVIAEALLDQYQDAALAAQKFRNPK